MRAKNKENIKPQHRSQTSFDSFSENSFLVMKDEETIIGVQKVKKAKKSDYAIVIENITNKELKSSIGSQKYKIRTLLFDDKTQSLFVGDYKSFLTKYKKDKNTLKWKKKATTKEVRIGRIKSSLMIGHTLIIGGNKGKIRLIDPNTMEFIGEPFLTSIGVIKSLKKFTIPAASLHGNIYLTMTGTNFRNLENKSDVLDITKIVDPRNKDMINVVNKLFQENLEIKQKIWEKDKNIKNNIKHMEGLSSQLQTFKTKIPTKEILYLKNTNLNYKSKFLIQANKYYMGDFRVKFLEKII
jgi:hypothetical protein